MSQREISQNLYVKYTLSLGKDKKAFKQEIKTNQFLNINHHFNLLQRANYSPQKISAQLCSGSWATQKLSYVCFVPTTRQTKTRTEISQGKFQPWRWAIPGRSFSSYSNFLTPLSLPTHSATLSLTPYQKGFTCEPDLLSIYISLFIYYTSNSQQEKLLEPGYHHSRRDEVSSSQAFPFSHFSLEIQEHSCSKPDQQSGRSSYRGSTQENLRKQDFSPLPAEPSTHMDTATKKTDAISHIYLTQILRAAISAQCLVNPKLHTKSNR